MTRCKLMRIIMLKLIQPHHILLTFLVHSENTSPTAHNCSLKTQFTQKDTNQYAQVLDLQIRRLEFTGKH